VRLGWWLLAGALASGALGCGDDDPEFWEDYSGKCATPRTGASPVTGEAYEDVQGSVDDEKRWLRLWTDDLYLWYDEVPDVDASRYPAPVDYFAVLKTPAVTMSGRPKDRFHFTYPSTTWEELSVSGIEVGYGLQWVVVSPSPPRRILVAFNQAGSPAAAAGLGRGAEIVSVDGIDVVSGTDVVGLNAGLFPDAPGERHTFVVRDRGNAMREVTLMSAAVMMDPVPTTRVLSTPSGPVGYLVFNDHIATAEAGLLEAMGELATAGVTDLILDLRYNGGGYLAIASQLAYMIAGPAATQGKEFERLVFNDRHPGMNPVTGSALAPTPFYPTTLGFSTQADQPLPNLGLSRVFVIGSSFTCSASEAIINGLRGIGVEVVLIGDTTCGKPYGFYPFDNCGTTYFSIQFQGVNALGFGEFGDGFVPSGAGTAGTASVPGCVVPDDFDHDLGDPAERRLVTALAYREQARCPAAKAAPGSYEGELPKPLWRQNAILLRK
jgi:carboxyl-terminal processing protease